MIENLRIYKSLGKWIVYWEEDGEIIEQPYDERWMAEYEWGTVKEAMNEEDKEDIGNDL